MRTPAKPLEDSTCADHTPSPDGYQAWHEWAEKMSKTHRARRCAECEYWSIWEPKP